MSWDYIDTIPGVAAGGPNPSDAFFMKFGIADLSPALIDATRFAFGFPESIVTPADAVTLALQVADTNPALSDSLLRLAIVVSETNIVPSDVASYMMGWLLNDPNVAPSDIHSLGITGFGDVNSVPMDARTFIGNFWLSGTTGTSGNTTTPANANGSNNGTLALAKTVTLGAAVASLTSSVGSGIPNGTPFTTATYKAWINNVVGLTSTTALIMQSTSALFADITMLTSTVAFNNLVTPFSFDLIAAGIDTLAKLQSCRVLFRVTDSLAGSGSRIEEDAGCIQLTNII